MNKINKLLNNKSFKVYFIGIGGCGMSSLALILKKLDYIVSGSDLITSKFTKKLEENDIHVNYSHDSKNVIDSSLIVKSSAIKNDNVEVIEANKLNIPIFHRSEILNYIINLHKNSIGILGTHGKGTVTGSVINCLESNSYNVNYSVGGILINKKNNFCIKNEKDYFVAEVDESDGSFLNLKLDYILINNLSIDHMDYFENFDNLLHKFSSYINNNEFKKIYLNLSDEGCVKLYEKLRDKNNIVSFGFSNKFDYYGEIISLKKPYSINYKYSYFNFKKRIFKTSLSGNFNINNLIGSLALSIDLGCDIYKLDSVIGSYMGLEDRFTTKFKESISFTKVYAHHPTEINLILKSFVNNDNVKIVAIYEPFGSKKFFDSVSDEFSNCFNNSDELIILNYKNKDISLNDIYNKINHENKKIIKDYNNVYKYLIENFLSNTALIFFGVPNKFKNYNCLDIADDLYINNLSNKNTIKDLLFDLNFSIFGNENTIVSHLSDNSNDIKKNSLFFCMKGNKFNGNDYIDEVIEKGCSCIVSDINPTRKDITWIKTDNVRKLMSEISSNFYGNYKFKIIGVTGTNGKTSTCFITYTNLYKNGFKTLYIGTLGVYYNGKKIKKLKGTTPNNLLLHKILQDYNFIDYLVMEVTSHALELFRVYKLNFEVVLLTNITRDHLDFHKTMENYINSKLKIFDLNSKYKIINQNYKHLIKYKSNIKLFGNNFNFINHKNEGIEIEIFYKNKKIKLNTPYYGNCYKENLLAFFSIMNCLDIKIKKFYFTKILGRMEKISENPNVIIDFAHTPDAIENVISSIKNISVNKKIAVVFGCGGDRDKSKRCFMKNIVQNNSDYYIITSDNPRTEDPEEICKQIGQKYITNREDAILKTFELNSEWIILILGKGDEDYQEFFERYYYSDKHTFNKIKTFYKKKILIIGYGLSGRSVEKKISKYNCSIDIFDDYKYSKEIDVNNYDFMIVSPGIKPSHKHLQNKITKFSEFEIGYQLYSNCKWIGITGTNGKSTTVSLLGMIYDNVVGNIGKPVTSLPDKIKYNDSIVAEVSSFQLRFIEKFRPNICVILNITTDHMDYHTDFEDYKNTKLKIAMNQKEGDFILIPYNFEFDNELKCLSKKIYFGKKLYNKDCVYERNDDVILFLDNKETKIFNIPENKLVGYFNKLNIIVAGTIAYLDGKKRSLIEDAVRNFEPLEHRLENFLNIGKTKFINNSVSTNADSCISSIKIYDNPIILILGGLTKNNNPYEKIFEFIKSKNNIKKILCYGDSVNEILEINKLFNYDFLITFSNLLECVDYIKDIVNDNDVILFSPSCSSFDQFRNYKERGLKFKQYCNTFFQDFN